MYTLEKVEKNKAKITITISKEEWEGYVQKSYEDNCSKFNIQGFRKGKAPRRVIEKNYGENVFFDDAFDYAFGDNYREVFKNEKDFDPINQPDVSIKSFDDNGLVVEAVVELMPEVKLGEYKGTKVKKATGEVDDEKVEKELKQVQERQARFVDVEREAKLGDIATIDFSGSVDGVKFDGGTAEDYRLELGSKSFIDTFEEQIVGMNLGQSKDVNVTFPTEYHEPSLAGKPAVFAVTLKKLEEKQLPELNDEFADNVSEFSTLEEYKADIKKHLQASLEKKLERENENKLIEAVVSTATLEVPEVLVERQLDLFLRDFEQRLMYQGLKLEDYAKYMNVTVEELRNQNRDQAVEAVKTRLALEQLVKEEGLTVTEAEVDAKLEETAKKYNKTLEEYKKSLGDKHLAYFENDILMDKVIKFLKENIVLE